MIKKYLSKRKLNIICSIAAILSMWLIWIIAYYAVGNDLVIPSFTDTAVSFWECITSGSFWIAFLNTLLRTLIAFAISFIIAALFAVASVLSKAFYAFIKPVMVMLRTLPTIAVVLLILLWANPKIAPVIVTLLVLFPMIHAQLIAAVGGIDGGLIEMAEVYNLSKRDRLLKIYLPLIAPNVLSQTGANISLGLKVMISAEVLAKTYKSLGGMMQHARDFVIIPQLAALTVTAIILGLIIDIAFSLLERITFKWSKKEGQND